MANKMRDIREILNQYNIPWKYGDKEEVEATVKMFNKIIEQEETDVTMIKMNPPPKINNITQRSSLKVGSKG